MRNETTAKEAYGSSRLQNEAGATPISATRVCTELSKVQNSETQGIQGSSCMGRCTF